MDKYYLQDSRQYVGNSMSWWARNGKGYTCDIRNAEIYTEEKAFSRHKSRETDIPWPTDYIDSRISHHIDVQHCDRGQLTNPDEGKYWDVHCPWIEVSDGD